MKTNYSQHTVHLHHLFVRWHCICWWNSTMFGIVSNISLKYSIWISVEKQTNELHFERIKWIIPFFDLSLHFLISFDIYNLLNRMIKPMKISKSNAIILIKTTRFTLKCNNFLLHVIRRRTRCAEYNACSAQLHQFKPRSIFINI